MNILPYTIANTNAPVVGRTHHNFTIGQQLGRLRGCFPPNYLTLDGIQFTESAVD